MRRMLFFILIWLTGVTIKAQNLDTLLDLAIQGKSGTFSGCKPVFVYKVLQTSQTDTGTVYYLLLYTAGYRDQNGKPKLCEAWSAPVVLVTEKNKVSLLVPRDGADYSRDIRRLFPPALQDKAFRMYKYLNPDRARAEAEQKAYKKLGYVRVKFVVPHDKQVYDDLMNKYVNGDIENPLPVLKFDTLEAWVPDTADVKKLAAIEAYRHFPPFGNPDNARLAYFKQQGNTVYVLTNADTDGWAGVSYFLAKVHPLIEMTLKLYPGVERVVWSAPDK